MVSETKDSAPYAPVHNVLTVIRRLRERGLPDPLTLQELERIGVPEGNAPRTLVALRFLGLVNEDGYRTEAFDRLGRASTDQYPEAFADILRAAYAPVFTVVDPAEDSEIAVHDAFRHYKPQAQRGRMVTLFLGLCREAGIVPGGPPARKAKMVKGTPPRTSRGPVRLPTAPVQPSEPGRLTESAEEGGPDYGLISKLMQQLPRSGKWTQSKRDKWLQAVAANVDLMVEIEREDTQE